MATEPQTGPGYTVTISGGRCALATRLPLTYMPPRECVALAAALLACADRLFKDEDARAPLRAQEG